MAADEIPLADAGIRHRKHARFHRTRQAAGTSGRRLLNGRCEPRRMRERSRSRALGAAIRRLTFIRALMYWPTNARCLALCDVLGIHGQPFPRWVGAHLDPSVGRRGVRFEHELYAPAAMSLRLFSEIPVRLWPGQLLAGLLLVSLLMSIFSLLRCLHGLQLRVEHNEYDPNETHRRNPGWQPDPQQPI